MFSPNTIAAIVALCVMALVWRGYWPLLHETKGAALDAFFRGVLLIVASVGLRFIHWDIARSYLIHNAGQANWFALNAKIGGASFNVIYTAIFLAGMVYFLRALYFLIPDADRKKRRWNTLTAAFYPSEKCLTVRAINKITKDKGDG